MERMLIHRRWLPVLAAGFAITGTLALASPAGAQSGAMRVLIPRLAHQGDAPGNFGRNIAREMRDLIDDLATHNAPDEGDLNDALRSFNLKEEDLDCTAARQAALQTGMEIVMCGEVSPAADGVQVDARFVMSETGEMYEIPTFVQPDEGDAEEAAAQRIFQEFQNYSQMMRFSMICADYADSGDWQSALRNCNDALAINGDATSALYGKGRALMELEQPEEAFQTFEHLLTINEQHDDAMLSAGIVAARLDRPEVARDYFNRYLELNPGNADVRLQVATDLANEGDPEGALRIAQEGLENNPDNVNLVEYIGHFAIRSAETVIADMELSQQQDPIPPEARGFYETAIEHYTQVFDQQGPETDTNVLQRLMIALTRVDRTEEAIELGERIVTAQADRPILWFAYADALYRSGRVDDALEALDRTEELNPEHPNLHTRRATVLLETGDMDRIRTAWQAVQESGTDPNQVARAIFAFGLNERYRQDQDDAALEYFQLAIDFAEDPETRGMASYLSGAILYNRASANEAETAAEAEQVLPIYRQALEYFNESRPYAEGPNAPPNVNLDELIQAANGAIEYAEAVIARGR